MHLGYPLRLLRLALRAYRWPRRITDGVTFADPAHTTTRGVIAGSAFAISELRDLVHCDILEVLATVSRLVLTLYVDDASAGAEGGTMHAVAHTLGALPPARRPREERHGGHLRANAPPRRDRRAGSCARKGLPLAAQARRSLRLWA